MQEVWLQSNRRVLFLAMVPVDILSLFGVLVLATDLLPLPSSVGIACLVISALLLLDLLKQLRQPRVAYRDGAVLFFLQAGRPITVPVGVLEAFFLGQGPAHLPVTSSSETKTVNLIARLSQRETEWQEREVKDALGDWKDGYVTIRGTWCEPLDTEVIRRLNSRLKEVQDGVTAGSNV